MTIPRDPAEAPPAAGATTQRLRVGALGLACVFLLVMLATALLHAAGDRPAAAANAVAANAAEPNEPLAQLGVAPGNAEPAPPATTAPRRSPGF